MAITNITDELKNLRELRLHRDKCKELYEQADKEFKKQQARVIDLMETEGMESAKVDGVLFSRVGTIFGYVNNRQKFIEWAAEYDEELFEPKERAQLVNEIVRERVLNNEELPPGVSFYVREYISQRAG